MDAGKKTVGTMVLATAVLLAGLVALQGCKESESTSEAIAQTTCPMTGKPINKDFVSEYKGKKAYFCGAGCKTAFDKEPEKYADKFPQFKN